METYYKWFTLAFIPLICANEIPQKHNKGSGDYCYLDTFEGTCSHDEVIIIDNAVYGRMANSKCLSKSPGHVGCFKDVKYILDGLCSGKTSCEVPVIHRDLIATRPCEVDIASYLTVSYSCLKVLTDSKGECSSFGAISIPAEEGYISSSMTHNKGSPCKYKLIPSSGKQLNISLLKFSSNGNNGNSNNPPICYETITIKEERNKKTILTCPSDAAEKSVYVSSGGRTEITFGSSSDLINYIVHFKAIGCQNPKAPKNSHIKRQGNKATVICNSTKDSWEVECEGNNWNGLDKECSGWAFASVMNTEEGYPSGMLLIIVIGIALGVLIGGFLLFLAINAFKRYHGLLPVQQIQNPSYEKPFYNPNKTAYNDRTIQRSSMIYGTNRRSYPNRQMPPPVPPPHVDNAQMRPPSEISEANRQSHIYETPLFNSL